VSHLVKATIQNHIKVLAIDTCW